MCSLGVQIRRIVGLALATLLGVALTLGAPPAKVWAANTWDGSYPLTLTKSSCTGYDANTPQNMVVFDIELYLDAQTVTPGKPEISVYGGQFAVFGKALTIDSAGQAKEIYDEEEPVGQGHTTISATYSFTYDPSGVPQVSATFAGRNTADAPNSSHRADTVCTIEYAGSSTSGAVSAPPATPTPETAATPPPAPVVTPVPTPFVLDPPPTAPPALGPAPTCKPSAAKWGAPGLRAPEIPGHLYRADHPGVPDFCLPSPGSGCGVGGDRPPRPARPGARLGAGRGHRGPVHRLRDHDRW